MREGTSRGQAPVRAARSDVERIEAMIARASDERSRASTLERIETLEERGRITRQEAGRLRVRLAKMAGSNPQVVARTRDLVRSARDKKKQRTVLEAIDTFEERGRLAPRLASKYRAMLHHRSDRLDLVLAETENWKPVKGSDLANFFVRLSTLIELDRYATGQRELKQALQDWSRDLKLSKRAMVRLLEMIERFRADSAVNDDWMQIFETQAARDSDVAAFVIRLKARRAWTSNAANVHIMSLGIHCLPWVVLNRWGLRSEEDLIRLDSPFNLAAHDVPTLNRLFSTDFEGYLDVANIAMITTARGKKVPINKLYRAFFNHHRLPYWLENNYERLMAVLSEKVENVRQNFGQSRAVYLIGGTDLDAGEESQAALRTLYGSIASRSVEPPLLVASAQRNFSAPAGVSRIDERIYVMNCPYPRPDYEWISEAISPAGLAYERGYVEMLCGILRSHGLWPEQEPLAA